MYYNTVLSILYVHKLLKIKKPPKKPKKCKTGVSNIVIEEMYALKKWHPKLNKTNIEKVTEKEKE